MSLLAWGNTAVRGAALTLFARLPCEGTVRTIATGGGQACAVVELAGSDHGVAVAWGSNETGACGLPSSLARIESPTRVPGLTAVDIVGVSCGATHTLWLSRDGRVYSVGYGAAGQLGCGDSIRRLTSPREVELGAHGVAVSIAAGGDSSFATTSDGSIIAWGSNSHGQLGVGAPGETIWVPMPLDTIGGPKGVTVTQVAAGPEHTLFISAEGALYAAGAATFWRLGLGDSEPHRRTRATPTRVRGGLESVTAVAAAAGAAHSLVLDSTGTVWGFGDNEAYAVGISLEVPEERANLAAIRPLGDAALCTAGFSGAIAPPAFSLRRVPVPTRVDGLPRGAVTCIAAGTGMSFAGTQNGEIWAWGRQRGGLLGGVDVAALADACRRERLQELAAKTAGAAALPVRLAARLTSLVRAVVVGTLRRPTRIVGGCAGEVNAITIGRTLAVALLKPPLSPSESTATAAALPLALMCAESDETAAMRSLADRIALYNQPAVLLRSSAGNGASYYITGGAGASGLSPLLPQPLDADPVASSDARATAHSKADVPATGNQPAVVVPSTVDLPSSQKGQLTVVGFGDISDIGTVSVAVETATADTVPAQATNYLLMATTGTSGHAAIVGTSTIVDVQAASSAGDTAVDVGSTGPTVAAPVAEESYFAPEGLDAAQAVTNVREMSSCDSDASVDTTVPILPTTDGAAATLDATCIVASRDVGTAVESPTEASLGLRAPPIELAKRLSISALPMSPVGESRRGTEADIGSPVAHDLSSIAGSSDDETPHLPPPPLASPAAAPSIATTAAHSASFRVLPCSPTIHTIAAQTSPPRRTSNSTHASDGGDSVSSAVALEDLYRVVGDGCESVVEEENVEQICEGDFQPDVTAMNQASDVERSGRRVSCAADGSAVGASSSHTLGRAPFDHFDGGATIGSATVSSEKRQRTLRVMPSFGRFLVLTGSPIGAQSIGSRGAAAAATAAAAALAEVTASVNAKPNLVMRATSDTATVLPAESTAVFPDEMDASEVEVLGMAETPSEHLAPPTLSQPSRGLPPAPHPSPVSDTSSPNAEHFVLSAQPSSQLQLLRPAASPEHEDKVQEHEDNEQGRWKARSVRPSAPVPSPPRDLTLPKVTAVTTLTPAPRMMLRTAHRETTDAHRPSFFSMLLCRGCVVAPVEVPGMEALDPDIDHAGHY